MKTPRSSKRSEPEEIGNVKGKQRNKTKPKRSKWWELGMIDDAGKVDWSKDRTRALGMPRWEDLLCWVSRFFLAPFYIYLLVSHCRTDKVRLRTLTVVSLLSLWLVTVESLPTSSYWVLGIDCWLIEAILICYVFFQLFSGMGLWCQPGGGSGYWI